jgi:sporulation protein YlmC with PRC-barrel domain
MIWEIIWVGMIVMCALIGAQSTAHAQGGYGTQDDYGNANIANGEHFRLGELIGKTVRNREGQNLGTVEDVIASEAGRISYLLLSVDGALGLTERWIPVPWQAANARVMRDHLVLGVSKNRLENAPSFSKGSLPDFSQQRVQSRINSYYEMDRVGEQGRYPSEERDYPSREEERRSESFDEEEDGRFGEYESYRHNGEADFERDDRYEHDDGDYEDSGRYDERSDEPSYRRRNSVFPY